MKNYLQTFKANWQDKGELYKKRLIYFFTFTLLLQIALLVYFLTTGKSPISLVPYGEYVKPQYLYSIYGSGDMGNIDGPLGLAVDRKQDRLYVTDNINKRIAVFTLKGEPLFAFNKLNKNKMLSNPVYIALDTDGKVYVSDSVLGKVCIFDGDGRFVSYLKTEEKYVPLGISFDEQENIYIADKASGRILKLNKDGRKIAEFGRLGKTRKPDELLSNLYFPNNVALTDKSAILVTDSNNRRIQLFKSDSSKGQVVLKGFLRGLAPVQSDNGEYFLTAKVFTHQIIAFKTNGKVLYGFGEQGSGDGQFLFPNDIAVSDNLVFIADRENDRIQVWGF